MTDEWRRRTGDAVVPDVQMRAGLRHVVANDLLERSSVSCHQCILRFVRDCGLISAATLAADGLQPLCDPRRYSTASLDCWYLRRGDCSAWPFPLCIETPATLYGSSLRSLADVRAALRGRRDIRRPANPNAEELRPFGIVDRVTAALRTDSRSAPLSCLVGLWPRPVPIRLTRAARRYSGIDSAAALESHQRVEREKSKSNLYRIASRDGVVYSARSALYSAFGDGDSPQGEETESQ